MLFQASPLSGYYVYSAVLGVSTKLPIQDLMLAECVPDVFELLSKSSALLVLYVVEFYIFVERDRCLLHVLLWSARDGQTDQWTTLCWSPPIEQLFPICFRGPERLGC